MIKIFRKIGILVLVSAFVFCGKSSGQKKNNKEPYSYTPMHYDSRPYYTVQLAKGGCKVEVIVNDFLVARYLSEPGGLSTNIPLNATLMKSGTHKITLKVYPAEGKNELDEYTYAEVDIRLFSDVDNPASDYTSILKFGIPEEVKTQQLPYFEMEMPFKASLPFDVSNLLKDAEVLKGQENIEKLIVEEYKKASIEFKKSNAQWFLDKRSESDKMFIATAFYFSKEQYEQRSADFRKDYFEPDAEHMHWGEYEIEYFANGKVATLINKHTKEHVLKSVLHKGTPEEEVITVGLGLYRKKGSNTFLSL